MALAFVFLIHSASKAVGSKKRMCDVKLKDGRKEKSDDMMEVKIYVTTTPRSPKLEGSEQTV